MRIIHNTSSRLAVEGIKHIEYIACSMIIERNGSYELLLHDGSRMNVPDYLYNIVGEQ